MTIPRRTTLLTLLIAGCSTDGSPRSTSSTPGQGVPADGFQELSAGCLGGVTGGGTGVTLFKSGALYRWSQADHRSEQRDSALIRTDSVLAGRLRSQLVKARFRELTVSEPANMTCFLKARDGPEAHELAWPMGDETRLPAPVRETYEELVRAGADQPEDSPQPGR